MLTQVSNCIINISMLNKDVLVKLLQLYRSNKYAPLFFEELATMKQSKPRIDLERRRRAINIEKKTNISRNEAVEFFSTLEQLKLGKLEIVKNVMEGNSKFHWTCKDTNPIDMAKEVLSRTQKNVIAHASMEAPDGNGRIYIYRTRSGKMVELTQDDIEDIKCLS